MPKSAKSTIEKTAMPTKKQRFFKWLLKTGLKVTLIFCFTLFIYAIYLDGKVKTRFEGNRWQIPVQVFGQTLSFSRGDTINFESVINQLKLMDYVAVASEKQLIQPKQYFATSHTLTVFTPEFDFPDGIQAATVITVSADTNRVIKVSQNHKISQKVRIPPQLLSRIVPSNKEDRVIVPLQQVPEQLLDILLLVEDRNFYYHHGVAPLGILRALYANFRAGRTVQGGSTLTQQLVKNMFLTREKTLVRKLNEAIMALLLEYHYSKDQLLEAYINEVYLGQQYANGIYGFGLAAQFYFDKTLSELTIDEMALLVAQIKGPSYYDPRRHPKRALQRRDLVLRLMYEQQQISKDTYVTAVNQPLSVVTKHKPQQQKYPAYLQLVKQELQYLLPTLSNRSGVKIFTGFSLYSQQLLEQTVQQKLSKIEQSVHGDNLEVAMLVTDIGTGQIRALLGGRETGYAGFNRALNAYRQIGSLIKPFIYAAALERYEQYNLATVLLDRPLSIKTSAEQIWQPENYDGKYLEQVNLIDALVTSRNIPTVNLGMALGLENISSALPMLGYANPINIRPSMLLGALNMAPIEINQLFLTLAKNS